MVALLVTNSVLIGIVALIALAVMVYWHRATRGGWRFYATGRANMGLLALIFLITGNAAVQLIIPLPISIRAPFYFLLYIGFAIALARIGFTIRNEINIGRAKAQHPAAKEPSHD